MCVLIVKIFYKILACLRVINYVKNYFDELRNLQYLYI